MQITGRLGRGGLVPIARIEVTGYADEPAHSVQVEPWGEMFDIGPETTVVVTFLGKAKRGAAPGVEIARASWGISLWAGSGCDDYLVTDRSGQPIVGH